MVAAPCNSGVASLRARLGCVRAWRRRRCACVFVCVYDVRHGGHGSCLVGEDRSGVPQSRTEWPGKRIEGKEEKTKGATTTSKTMWIGEGIPVTQSVLDGREAGVRVFRHLGLGAGGGARNRNLLLSIPRTTHARSPRRPVPSCSTWLVPRRRRRICSTGSCEPSRRNLVS